MTKRPKGFLSLSGIYLALTTLCIIGITPVEAEDTPIAASTAKAVNSMPQGSRVAIAVYDLQRKRMIFTHRDHEQLRLASVAKLPVSAAALLDLTPSYQFTTSIMSMDGPIRNRSIGRLGIIGRGDPCLDEHHTNKQPDTIFVHWAQALKSQGLTNITGDIIIDASYFAGPIRPTTYPGGLENAQAWYSAPASAFAWNNNCIEVQVRPSTLGQPAGVYTRPRSKRITIRNKAITANSRLSKGIIVSRSIDSNTLFVSGRYQKPTSWFPVSIHQEPNLLAGDHLAAIFKGQGITVSGQVKLGIVPTTGHLLHEHTSEIMGALDILNRRSQNFYGEQIIRILGQKHHGEGSTLAGVQTVEDILKNRLDLPREHIDLKDGSGLSYDNTASAWYITQLLARMDRHEYRMLFQGTLRDGAVNGATYYFKTGSLAVANCLAGFIEMGPDKRFAFTILINKAESKSGNWRKRNDILRAIIADLK